MLASCRLTYEGYHPSTSTSISGSRPSFSDSKVNASAGWRLFSTSEYCRERSWLSNRGNVSSTNLSYRHGQWCSGIEDSQGPTKMSARMGPKGNPIATPSTCLYIWLLKLNSISVVPSRSNFQSNFSGVRGSLMCGSRYYGSLQMSIVSARGTLVNKLITSYEHMKKVSLSCSLEYSSTCSQNSKVSLIVFFLYLSATGFRTLVNHFAMLCCVRFVTDKMGRRGFPSLCYFWCTVHARTTCSDGSNAVVPLTANLTSFLSSQKKGLQRLLVLEGVVKHHQWSIGTFLYLIKFLSSSPNTLTSSWAQHRSLSPVWRSWH